MESYKEKTTPNILKVFAKLLDTDVENWQLTIPEKYGIGYCKGFIFNKNIRMLILNYALNEDLIGENPDVNSSLTTILFKFQNIFPETKTIEVEKASKPSPSVLIATSSFNSDIMIPIHSSTATINIEVDANYLNELFEFSEKSLVLQSLLQCNQPLVFEQVVYPSLQKIVDEIVVESVDETYKLFFLKIKAEELICSLLMELEKRNTRQLYTLNNKDIETIYKIKEEILRELNNPPVINNLAILASMSPTKLKRLFTQIFGNSIFNYYQEFRMKEAAFLLKEGKLSVSEVGYKMGFSNLSHFSKVFTAHIGMKPKKYSGIYVKTR